MSRSRILLVALVSFIGGGLLALPQLFGVHTLPVPRGPEAPLDVEDLDAALDVAVTSSGTVDYGKLRAERDPLLRFVQALAAEGPKTRPEGFATRPERLAYYLNAYNALVLYGVLVHAPETSVHDVRGPIEPLEGFGFFWAQRFELDGERVNLYDLENEVIRSFGDARVHAAINCASRSCPPLRETPLRAATLDEDLDRAARDWVASDAGVIVEPGVIRPNAIFEWFEEDFEAHAEALGAGSDALDWIGHHLEGAKKQAFARAREAGAEVRYQPYDWRLNRAGAR